MRCPTLSELPPPPLGKTGWPWTEETPQLSLTQLPKDGDWPRVSIVTPSYNQGNFIEETIRSVLLQGYPNLEYIIVDGGSKDDSVDIIRKYERWLSFWVSEPDGGVTNAVNKGFAKATGEFFGIMCGDDFYMPGGILKLMQLRLENQNSVLWAGVCPDIDFTGQIIHEGLPFVREPKEIGDWGFGAWFACVACLFSAEAFRSLGGFDERFKTANDAECWIRLGKIGSFSFINDRIATARFNPDSVSHRDLPGEVVALITMNYLHGCRDVSKTILERYVTAQIKKSLDVDDLAKNFGIRILVKAFKKRIYLLLKKRFFVSPEKRHR